MTQSPQIREDYVYHITLSDRLNSLGEGLNPNPNRDKSEDWQQLERHLDQNRPPAVTALGISRAISIYAHVEPSFITEIFDRKTRSHSKAAARLVALQIKVNPTEVIVCDAFPLNYRYAGNIAERYWSTAMPLKDYRAHYGTGNSWFHIVKNESAPEHLPLTLVQPEVLIPGPIEADRIKWFASSARNVNEHIYRSW